jgi:hypothetical protein
VDVNGAALVLPAGDGEHPVAGELEAEEQRAVLVERPLRADPRWCSAMLAGPRPRRESPVVQCTMSSKGAAAGTS